MNRDQFLQSITDAFKNSVDQAAGPHLFQIGGLFRNDKTIFDIYNTAYLRSQERITYWMNLYDSNPSLAESSFVPDLGSASVNPVNAMKWPPTDGVFGNVITSQLQSSTNQLSKYSATVNATSSGNTLIFTTASTTRFVPTSITISLNAVSGLSLVATVSVGSNASSYDNISSATLLTGLSVLNNIFRPSISSTGPTIAPDTPVYCRVSIPSTASTYQLIVTVVGYYI